jgi:hypothetical protein
VEDTEKILTNPIELTTPNQLDVAEDSHEPSGEPIAPNAKTEVRIVLLSMVVLFNFIRGKLDDGDAVDTSNLLTLTDDNFGFQVLNLLA